MRILFAFFLVIMVVMGIAYAGTVPDNVGFHELRYIVNGSGNESVDANEDGIIDWAFNVVNSGGMTGSGTLGYLPEFDSAVSVIDSPIQHVGGSIRVGSDMEVTGRLGVGDGTPGARLTIQDNGETIRLQSNAAGEHNYITFFPEGEAGGMQGYIGYPTGGATEMRIRNQRAGGHIVLEPNGNVAIGNIIPTVKLDIRGLVVRLSGGDDVKFQATARDDDSRSWLALSAREGSTQKEWRVMHSGDIGSRFSIYESDVDMHRLVIANGGNVGIGEVDPQTLLHLRRSTFGPGDTPMLMFHEPQAGAWQYIAGVTFNEKDFLLERVVNGPPDFGVIGGILGFSIEPSGGNMGIGKLEATEKLDVAGNIVASGTICDGAGDCIGPGGGLWTKTASSIHPTILTDNVGIGTSTPGGKLEVDTGGVWNVADFAMKVINLDADAGESFGMLVRAGGNDANSRTFEVRDLSGNTDFIITGDGRVGIGNNNPARAILETAGMVGNTLALFGQGTRGISLIADWPVIGFNTYFDGQYLSISDGYAGAIGVSPSNGRMGFYSGTDSAGSGIPPPYSPFQFNVK